MSKSLIADMTHEENEIKGAIERMLAEVERNREKMQIDQEEIERLKSHTRAMLTQLEVA